MPTCPLRPVGGSANRPNKQMDQQRCDGCCCSGSCRGCGTRCCCCCCSGACLKCVKSVLATMGVCTVLSLTEASCRRQDNVSAKSDANETICFFVRGSQTTVCGGARSAWRDLKKRGVIDQRDSVPALRVFYVLEDLPAKLRLLLIRPNSRVDLT